MLDKKGLDELVKTLCESLPPSIVQAKKDMEKNFRSILQSAFARMDLVTREEFDAQVGVLTRTRKKLDALVKKIEGMEKPKKGR